MPVFTLSLANVKRTTLADTLADLRRILRIAVEAHNYLADSPALTSSDRAFLERVADDDGRHRLPRDRDADGLLDRLVAALFGDGRLHPHRHHAVQVVTRDVIERFGTVQYRVARRFARSALRSTGLSFSVNKQIMNLRSLGISVGTEKAYALLDDLEDAHLIFWVGDYNLSVRDNPRSVQKAYAVDPGLALAVAPASHLDVGQRLETTVFIELMRRYGEDGEGVIASYRAEDVPEVDFVVGDASLEEQYLLVQVARDIGDAHGDKAQRARYRREVGGLEAAMRRCGFESATIVTLEQETSISTASGTIEVVPACKWCLWEGDSQICCHR